MVRASSSQPTIDITAPPEFFGNHNVDQLLFTPEVLSSTDPFADESPIRIEALHAMKDCARWFCFKEVEQISAAHPDLYAGVRLHDDIRHERHAHLFEEFLHPAFMMLCMNGF
jgi:hypothetical protein